MKGLLEFSDGHVEEITYYSKALIELCDFYDTKPIFACVTESGRYRLCKFTYLLYSDVNPKQLCRREQFYGWQYFNTDLQDWFCTDEVKEARIFDKDIRV